MSQPEVRIVDLPALHVASATAYSESPEVEAWKRLKTWATAKGLLDQPGYRLFGFDNPAPSTGSPNYGYEFWITVSPEVQPEGEIKIKDFPGGRYAVLHVYVTNPWDCILPAWERLVKWAEEGSYHIASHQCLEEHFVPSDNERDFELDLYLPIA